MSNGSLEKNEILHGTNDLPSQGKPKLNYYRIRFWRKGYAAKCCHEAENEAEAEAWFYRRFRRHDQNGCHTVLRIDELGDVRTPRDELSAIARQVKQAHLESLEKINCPDQDFNGQHHDAMDNLSTAAPCRQPSYRIWYWYSVAGCLTHEAENEKKAAEWFHARKPECEDELTTYTLDKIEKVSEGEVLLAYGQGEELAARAAQSSIQNNDSGATKRDFFAELKKLRDKQQAEQERQT